MNLNSLLILEDLDNPGSVYEYILVDNNRLSEAYDVVKNTYKDWDPNIAGSDIFEIIFQALDKAGIFYRRIEDWCTCLF